MILGLVGIFASITNGSEFKLESARKEAEKVRIVVKGKHYVVLLSEYYT